MEERRKSWLAPFVTILLSGERVRMFHLLISRLILFYIVFYECIKCTRISLTELSTRSHSLKGSRAG